MAHRSHSPYWQRAQLEQSSAQFRHCGHGAGFPAHAVVGKRRLPPAGVWGRWSSTMRYARVSALTATSVIDSYVAYHCVLAHSSRRRETYVRTYVFARPAGGTCLRVSVQPSSMAPPAGWLGSRSGVRIDRRRAVASSGWGRRTLMPGTGPLFRAFHITEWSIRVPGGGRSQAVNVEDVARYLVARLRPESHHLPPIAAGPRPASRSFRPVPPIGGAKTAMATGSGGQ